jgi:hypothetical protein
MDSLTGFCIHIDEPLDSIQWKNILSSWIAVAYSEMLRANPAFCSSECNNLRPRMGAASKTKSWKWDEARLFRIGAACGTSAILVGFSDRPAECQVNQPPTHWLHPSTERLTIPARCHLTRSVLQYPLLSCQLQIDGHLSVCRLCICLCTYGSKIRDSAVGIATGYGVGDREVGVRDPVKR